MNILNEKLRPINSRFAFIQADINSVVAEFIEWQKPILAAHLNTLILSEPNLGTIDTLLSLCPITVAEIRKYLFIPTKNDWVMFLDNGHLGTDRTIPEVLSEFLRTKMIYISISPQGNLFELYNGGKLVRFVGVSKESSWKFYQNGTALEFENTISYKKRIIKDRLTPETIIGYLHHFGIDVLNDDYLNTKLAKLVAKNGNMFKNTRELSLAEAQNFFK